MRRALLIAALLFVAACGEEYDGPTEGYVVRHEFDDDDSYYQPGHTIDGGETCYGGTDGYDGRPYRPEICTDNPDTHVPGYWVDVPERYLLVIANGDDEGKFQVPREIYNDVKDGQWFNTETGQVELR